MKVTEIRQQSHIHEATDVTFFPFFKSRMDYEAYVEAAALETPPVEMGRQSVTLAGRKEVFRFFF